MTPAQLAEIKSRLNNIASPLPWERIKNEQTGYYSAIRSVGGLGLALDIYDADAEFIAHAPEDIAVLVEAYETLYDINVQNALDLEKVTDEYQKYKYHYDCIFEKSIVVPTDEYIQNVELKEQIESLKRDKFHIKQYSEEEFRHQVREHEKDIHVLTDEIRAWQESARINGELVMKWQEKCEKLTYVLVSWLSSIPTKEDGTYCEINQWHACRAMEALK